MNNNRNSNNSKTHTNNSDGHLGQPSEAKFSDVRRQLVRAIGNYLAPGSLVLLLFGPIRALLVRKQSEMDIKRLFERTFIMGTSFEFLVKKMLPVIIPCSPV